MTRSKRDKTFPIILTLGSVIHVEHPQGKAKCTITQVNRNTLTAAGDRVKVKIKREPGDDSVTVTFRMEDADGRERLVE